MNTLVSLTAFPVATVLLQWTALLALCWMTHCALRKRHARWRLILWRSALCFALVLPVAQALPLPTIEIPVEPGVAHLEAFSRESPPSEPLQLELAGSQPSAIASERGKPDADPTFAKPFPVTAGTTGAPLSWATLLLLTWTIGLAAAGTRLVLLHLSLSRIVKRAAPANSPTMDHMRKIAGQMGLRRPVEVRVSDSIQSPFVCGLLRPTILVPRKLLESLSPLQTFALFAHEIAHVVQRDVLWCVAWRWMQAVCWFHPIVWKIPSAHYLACELEADRIASARFGEPRMYTQTLAELALRVVSPPTVETSLTVNGTSQIVRRLNHLRTQRLGIWKTRHTVIATVLVGSFLSLSAGFQLTSVSAAAPAVEEPASREVRVVVLDIEGNPIEGATIEPTGLRARGILRVNQYMWRPEVHGARTTAATDSTGQALVRYPVEVLPGEDLLTDEIAIVVAHPGFGPTSVEIPVAGTAAPIQLERAARAEVSAYFGEDRQPVTEVVPTLSVRASAGADPWTIDESGTIEFARLAPGPRLLQLSGRLPSGEIVHSEPFAFAVESGEHRRFELEMRPGIRLEGRIDESVPRPVTSGRVIVSVRPDEGSPSVAGRGSLHRGFGSVRFWTSYREIERDGSFVFESLPAGEVGVIVYGDGFISKSEADSFPGIAYPQTLSLRPPVTSIEVVAESTATLQVTASTREGEPVEGATVRVWPNVYGMGEIGTSIFGEARSLVEGNFRRLPSLPELSYSAKTDGNGVAVLSNVPHFTRSMAIEHPEFEAPVHAENYTRNVAIELFPGERTEVKIALQPKGTEALGDLRELRPDEEEDPWIPVRPQPEELAIAKVHEPGTPDTVKVLLKTRDFSEELHIEATPRLDGSYIKAVQRTEGHQGRAVLTIKFTEEGARRFAELTREVSDGGRLAIIVGGDAVSAPRVLTEITGGIAQITGLDEAIIERWIQLWSGRVSEAPEEVSRGTESPNASREQADRFLQGPR